MADEVPDDWWVKSGPHLAKTHACLMHVSDHLGDSDVMAESWWNGEGYTITVMEKGQPDKRIELSEYQLRAALMCIKTIRKAEVASALCSSRCRRGA